MTQGQYGVAVYFLYWTTQATFPGLPTADYQLAVTSLAGYATTSNAKLSGPANWRVMPVRFRRVADSCGRSQRYIDDYQYYVEYPRRRLSHRRTGLDGVITSRFKAALDIGDYSVSITTPSQTVLLGNTTTFPIQVTSINNYGGNFTSTCTGIPAPGVCTVNGFRSGVRRFRPAALRSGATILQSRSQTAWQPARPQPLSVLETSLLVSPPKRFQFRSARADKSMSTSRVRTGSPIL